MEKPLGKDNSKSINIIEDFLNRANIELAKGLKGNTASTKLDVPMSLTYIPFEDKYMKLSELVNLFEDWIDTYRTS